MFGHRRKRRVARVADRDQDISHKAVTADAFDGRGTEHRAEARVVERRKLGKQWCAQCVSRMEPCFTRSLREFVPRADGKAIVAAIDAIAHGFAEFARDMSLMFDRE